MKNWFLKKFKSLRQAGVKYFGIHLLLPIGIPISVIIIAILFAILGGISLNWEVLKNTFINAASQIMYFSIITFIMICRYIIKDNNEKKDFLQKGDFWISLVMLIIFIIFYGMQVYTSIQLNTFSNRYATAMFIAMFIMLYLSTSVNSEYCDDSESSSTKPSELANNREVNDNQSTSWESKL